MIKLENTKVTGWEAAIRGMRNPMNSWDKSDSSFEDVFEDPENLNTYYMKNAATIKSGLQEAGFEVYGGVNAPYIWLKTPEKMTSWEFFDYLLEQANVVGTPGSGFGPSGEGYFRLTAFGSYENTVAALDRIKAL